MNFNKVVVLGAASLLISALPVISYASTATQEAITHPATSHAMLAQTQVAIAQGTFVAAEQPTAGTVRIVEDGGHRYLEFDNTFSTSSQGPDLHVLLDTAGTPPASYPNQGRTINLGSLSSYTGAQRYPIPDAINLSNYQSVVIWCRMANATFGYAPLQPTTHASVR